MPATSRAPAKASADYVHTPTKSIRYAVRRRGGGFQAQFNVQGVQHRLQLAAPNITQALVKARGLVIEELERKPPLDGSLRVTSAVTMYLSNRWPELHQRRQSAAPKERAKNGEWLPQAAELPGQKTFVDFCNRLAHFADYAGADADLAQLDYDQSVGLTQRFFTARREHGLSARSLVNYQRVLSKFFGWLLVQRDDDRGKPLVSWRHNPASSDEIALESPEGVLLPSLTDLELDLLLTAAEGTPLWPSVVLCYGAGARPIEAVRVKWSETNLDKKTIILRGKKKPREIELSTWTTAQLRALQRTADSETIIGCTQIGQNKRLERLRRQYALPEFFDLQALRRTAAKRAAPSIPVMHYAEYFGHSLDVAQQHYIGYGLLGVPKAVDILCFPGEEEKTNTKTSTKPNKKRA